MSVWKAEAWIRELRQYNEVGVVISMQAYKQYEPEFKAKGLWYEHRLIDDMVAQVRLRHRPLARCRVETHRAARTTPHSAFSAYIYIIVIILRLPP